MIISQKNRRADRYLINEQLILAFLFLVLILLSLWVFRGYRSNTNSTVAPAVVHCSAEVAKGNRFINDGAKFSGGQWQSNERAHTGKYSCKIPQGTGAQFGLSYRFKDPVPGHVYKASVWRYKTPRQEGKLVVQGKGTDVAGFHFEEVDPVRKEDTGWEQLAIRFTIPVDQNLEEVQLYVYTDGHQAIFFDDLRLEKIADWPPEAQQLDILDVTIKPQAMQKLQRKREEAIRLGILEAAADDWVAAKIVQGDSLNIPIKVRLKGDWLDHLTGNKWSFRIKVKEPYNWNRLQVFSLHTPAARHFLHEWLLHQFWDREDVLTTRYDFVQLRVNGQAFGIYAYEEHFAKQLVEFNERREGPIVKFSEDGYWAGIARQEAHHGYVRFGTQHSAMDAQHSEIAPFGEAELEASATLTDQFTRAQELMEAYRSGAQPVAAIFDLDRLAKYYAIADLFNAYHGLVWHNQRYYYNPVLDKLEPIGFDGFGSGTSFNYTFLGEAALHPAKRMDRSFHTSLFMDPAFVAKYLQHLYRFADRTYFDAFLDEVYPAWASRLQTIQLEFPDYQPVLKELVEQADFIRSLILPYNNQSLKAFPGKTKEGKSAVIVSNTHTLPLEVVGYGWNDQQPAERFADPLLLPGHTTRHLQSRLRRDPTIRDFSSIRFLEQGALEQQAVLRYDTITIPARATHIFYRLLGFETLYHSAVRSWPQSELPTVVADPPQPLPLVSNDYFSVAGRQIRWKPGDHQLDSLLFMPVGYECIMPADTRIDLVRGGAIVSYAPVQLMGTEELPVKIYSSDGKGDGFHVLQTAGSSSFKHVIFDNLNTLNQRHWNLTGAVTCYEADANFYRCVFRNIHAEDALNTVRSHFTLAYCQMSDTDSDAFDSDFCKGEVDHCNFARTGNDAMDFSGSIVNVKDCTMTDCGDKGISVGEASDVTVFDSQITGAPIGIASKDLSLAYLRNIQLRNCEQGFVAFQKKSEFGGGRIIVEGYQVSDVRRLHTISEGSSLQLDQQLIQ